MKHNIAISGVEIPDDIPNHVIRHAVAALVPYFNGVISDLMLQCGRESPIGGWVKGVGATTTIEREKPQPVS